MGTFFLPSLFVAQVFCKAAHLEGGDGTLYTFVAVFAASAVKGLLHIVGGEHTKDHGTVMLQRYVGDALRYRLADKLKMTGVALYDAAYADDGVDLVVVLKYNVGGRRELKGSGHVIDEKVLLLNAIGSQRLHSAVK